ncbi:MAG: CaiB/BaiF CoA transferase family protein [Acidimicrobiales bacterium]
MSVDTPPPLADLRVLELATVVAGPGCGRYLADFGADVIKIERPGAGDSTRTLGWRHPTDDTTYWWKLLGRNKRCIELDLKSAEGRESFLALVATADVVIENFRPGKLEALGLGPDVLWSARPQLVITRISGFGQTGPYAQRPGFATLAEAMSGFAAINGTEASGPTLPPIALTDEVTALTAAFATMVALHSGEGQVVDVNLLESMFQVMGPLLSVYAATGYRQPRMGSELPYSVPRNTYRCADGRWVAVSASSESVGPRVMALVGLDPVELASFEARVDARERINAAVSTWIGARTSDEVLAGFAEVDAAVALVFDAADIATDPHFAARQALVELDGSVMQGLVADLSATPGRLRWAGRSQGADTAEVLADLTDPDP